ncbi:hypothetical protein PHYSODRAFT_327972 [Phytophthora sojae]|uniref:Uncharacterized protein n=1 Tax=Phytophthora sojae (strain P6497) TaxID=1094619 RepID=G4Z9T6_PHYSP|nr:hypothetical protein PHYSODRAFT_327972 [Phytophthora sojae]EGZ19789.1 hypothetical protein PHYSODRAFT_327972 [Phytophthora sojae]|eukprot:XP_009522506.1 hypothetical protein PHYSODRAFT_327972 [Phytophthora sojae]
MSRHWTLKKSGSKKDGDKKDGGKTKVSSGKNKRAKKTTKSSVDLDGVVQPCVLVPLKDKVEAFVRAISDAYSQAADGGAAVPPPPFAMPNPLTTESFKKALVAHVRERPLQPLGTSCLPGDIGETARAVNRLVLWN